MTIKQLLARMGLGTRSTVARRVRISQETAAREQFEQEVRDQLLQLKKKGLGIPIFTL